MGCATFSRTSKGPKLYMQLHHPLLYDAIRLLAHNAAVVFCSLTYAVHAVDVL